jgi:hypothetical protein
MVDKVRIKKRHQERITQWSTVLEIPESRVVEDAIDFYLKYLEGKTNQGYTVTIPILETPLNPQTMPDNIADIEDPEDYDGGIDL